MKKVIHSTSRAVRSAIDSLSKEITSQNVPALVLVLRGKSIDAEVEVLRKRLKDRHEAELLPNIQIAQDDSQTGSHYLIQLCAVTDVSADPIPASTYPQYEGVEAEWVVNSGKTYESALPRVDNALSDVRLEVASDDFFVTVTLIPNEPS